MKKKKRKVTIIGYTYSHWYKGIVNKPKVRKIILPIISKKRNYWYKPKKIRCVMEEI